MSQLIIGLFATEGQATSTVHELSSIGVEAGQIVTIVGARADLATEGGDAPAADQEALLFSGLRAAGLSDAQAHAHAEALRNGAVAVIITPGDLPGANIKAVMLSHGSLDIDSSAPEPNTLGQRPHLEPDAASSGIGLRDPGAIGVDGDSAGVSER